jgi:hypothetical protein
VSGFVIDARASEFIFLIERAPMMLDERTLSFALRSVFE